MATPYRSTCTVDGTSFDCVSVSVALQTAKDQNSMPLMTSMKVGIDCLVDFHDDNNVPYSTLKQVFALAQGPKPGNYVPIKIVFWKDEEKHTLQTVSMRKYLNGGFFCRLITRHNNNQTQAW